MMRLPAYVLHFMMCVSYSYILPKHYFDGLILARTTHNRYFRQEMELNRIFLVIVYSCLENILSNICWSCDQCSTLDSLSLLILSFLFWQIIRTVLNNKVNIHEVLARLGSLAVYCAFWDIFSWLMGLNTLQNTFFFQLKRHVCTLYIHVMSLQISIDDLLM